MRMVLVIALALLASTAPLASAQIASRADPLYHGVLDITPGRGTIDRETGSATLKVRRWRFLATSDSNGVYPDQEPAILALAENNFLLPAGMPKPSCSGESFTYRVPKNAGPHSIRLLRVWRTNDGTYRVRFTLAGVELSRLLLEDPLCLPMAAILGDDDGFSGVTITRRSFRARRLTIPKSCDVGDQWPWIR